MPGVTIGTIGTVDRNDARQDENTPIQMKYPTKADIGISRTQGALAMNDVAIPRISVQISMSWRLTQTRTIVRNVVRQSTTPTTKF